MSFSSHQAASLILSRHSSSAVACCLLYCSNHGLQKARFTRNTVYTKTPKTRLAPTTVYTNHGLHHGLSQIKLYTNHRSHETTAVTNHCLHQATIYTVHQTCFPIICQASSAVAPCWLPTTVYTKPRSTPNLFSHNMPDHTRHPPLFLLAGYCLSVAAAAAAAAAASAWCFSRKHCEGFFRKIL